MPKGITIQWLDAPEEHDYPAAGSYLSLLFDDSLAGECVIRLRGAPVREFRAKDLFRASGHSLLGISNSHVAKDQGKIASGTPLSPLLLVRDVPRARLIIADGYHRLCAVYAFDEDAVIRCKLV